jgi:hypothetical protein
LYSAQCTPPMQPLDCKSPIKARTRLFNHMLTAQILQVTWHTEWSRCARAVRPDLQTLLFSS